MKNKNADQPTNQKALKKQQKEEEKLKRKAEKERIAAQAQAKKAEQRAEAQRLAQQAAERKAKQKEAERAAQLKALQEKHEKCGDVLASGVVGLKSVTVYSKGYVEIGGIFAGAFPQKLLGISSNLNTKKKNMVGRGLGTVVSGGANLLFTSGNKGMAILTIITDTGSQVIKVDSPKDTDIKAILEIEAAGEAAIELGSTLVAANNQVTSSTPEVSSISSELEKLVALRDSGAISPAEFTAAKKKLLG